MEKMMYERPVMRAQLFQANEYVANCNDVPEFVGVQSFFQAVCGTLNLFFSTDRVAQRNPNTYQNQYYFNEYEDKDTTDSTYFLEWSADDNTYYVYEDSAKSGTGWNGGVLTSTAAADTKAGQGTLQVNTGVMKNPYNCINIFGDKWFSDKLIGEIDELILGEDQKVSYTSSY